MIKAAEQQLLDEVARGEPPAMVVETGAIVDVGQWFRSGRVCVACFTGRVALFATGKRPYRVEIPAGELGNSFYNFLTGELVLTKGCRLQLAPLEAQKVLEQIKGKEVSHA